MSYIQVYIQENILYIHRFIQSLFKEKGRLSALDSIRKNVRKIAKKSCSPQASKVLLAVIAALLIAVCISSIMRANMQKKYTSARQIMQEQLYTHLREMTELFSRVGDPDVDVQHKLIPMMNASYTAVASLNTALKEGYGSGSALLSDAQIAAIDAAFEEYFAAYRGGGPTGLAEADMRECMAGIRLIVDERFAEPTVDPNLMVVPNTPAP